ncbi:RbsD/FucU family protein [Alkalicoccobacillus plakortidis]|uniref:Fucose isomerase n=1 Tax=Alkalicoccobacillus plakortidis TaxID=444060 RepID=A0ABT0XEY6_9BACI|nr:RbsD/FucU domain-containing protein [Alkalicoccobacillus plakortidis]MCM2674465.1 fucose isomerase [Alkalicoccobacillus plakortidis]
MLKGIPSILSPELVKILMEMGHGDEIVLADAHFPAASHTNCLIRSDGTAIPELLEAILKLFPLDDYVSAPLILMKVVPGDDVETPIWQVYQKKVGSYSFEHVERFEFYQRAKQAYAIIATSEKAQYANLIIKKGVVKEEELR